MAHSACPGISYQDHQAQLHNSKENAKKKITTMHIGPNWGVTYLYNGLSAYTFDQNGDKVGKSIFEDITFLDPKTLRCPQGGPKNISDPENHFNVHRMA